MLLLISDLYIIALYSLMSFLWIEVCPKSLGKVRLN